MINEEQNEKDFDEKDLNENEEAKEQSDEVLEAKDNEINELNNKLMRLQADFINYKKRSDKEKENSINYGIESVVIELLPIIDNFSRALNSEVDKEDSFFKGISMIEKQLEDMLKKLSVEEIESLGQPFDPNLHHAVIMEDSSEYEAGVVTEVLQIGYRLKEKVIRPSMVKVSK